jgi:hypothetical protein
MHDYTANAGYATWHARNWRVIPSGTQMGALPASNGGLEVIWKIKDPALGRDTDVCFIWAADGTPVRGSYRIVDWATDETLNSGTVWDEDALVRIFTLAAHAA